MIEEWFKWWNAGTGQDAYVTNVTANYAALNVAGPYARQTLSKLTEVDLSPKAFRYMRFAQGDVAGIPAMLLRIGFVGEPGWEVHVPAEYAEYLWEAVMEAGCEFGIAPFGLEAQRVLRLEKKHVIVGQDTDAVSNPLEGDMEWTVRFDKEDFIGPCRPRSRTRPGTTQQAGRLRHAEWAGPGRWSPRGFWRRARRTGHQRAA